MALYTSYYAKKLPPNFIRVSISLGFPHWEKPMPRLLNLAPTPQILSVKDEQQYKVLYMRLLESIGIVTILDAIASVTPHDSLNTNVAFLCYESLLKPGQFCHRRMLAEYVERHSSLKIPEFM
jgi:hypothetical protein